MTTLFTKLQGLKTLQPDPINGALFNQLFDLVTMTKMTTRQEKQVSQGASRPGECYSHTLRRFWPIPEYKSSFLDSGRSGATRRTPLNWIFRAGSSPAGPRYPACQQTWETFPYLDQYRQLARMEGNTLDTALGERCLPPVRKMAFLGSGPTPFSALCFRERLDPEAQIVNIDRSVEAITHGRQVAEALGETFCGNMSFVRAEVTADTPTPSSSDDDASVPASPDSNNVCEILSLPDMSDFDLIHFAALIGETEKDKQDLLIAVVKAMKSGALLMLRSTDSLRKLLYPKMDVECWEVLSVVTPVLATRYFGGSTSLTAIVVSVDGRVRQSEDHQGCFMFHKSIVCPHL